MEKMFREAGFRGGISTKKDLLDIYSQDESIFSIKPQVVIQPKNRRDVEIATTVIARETKRFTSLSLTPRAAGASLSGGSLTDSIVIDVCAHLNKFGEITKKKNQITFTCEPGAMWRDLEKKLKEHNAYLPTYPVSKDISTIGGSVANNSGGPNSFQHGYCADWVESLDVVLFDGHTYTVKPLTYREFKLLTKQEHEYARIVKEIFDLVSKNEKEIKQSEKNAKNNIAGYPLWKVLPNGVTKFKKGIGTFDLTRLIAGSQGSIGIITNLTMRALEIPKNNALIVLPIFNLEDSSDLIKKALKYNPINIEIFDSLTFDLALQNPSFFKKKLEKSEYYKVMFSMYTTYHVRFGRKTPEFIILITLDEKTTTETEPDIIAQEISNQRAKARFIKNPIESKMYWMIRNSSYALSKLYNNKKRPAAFLEDIVISTENFSKFFVQVKQILKEFNITATMHGHGGDGHFHFYPLLDFTNKTTPVLIDKLSDKFLAVTSKLNGSISGIHNDSIIQTPNPNKIFSKKMLSLFNEVEQIFDPDDIFNPGKKINPRFNIKKTIRAKN
jgi:FAD/FMN-containing dehydrogenase